MRSRAGARTGGFERVSVQVTHPDTKGGCRVSISDAGAMVAAIQTLVGEENAKTIKDMGRTMSALKEKYAGRMDFAKASGVVKELLA